MPSQSWQMVATLNEPESTHDMESTPAWLADGTHLLEVYGVRPLCGRQVNPCNEAGTAGAQLLESIENCVPRVQILMSFRLPPFHWKSAMRKPWEESLRGALHVLSLPVLRARSRDCSFCLPPGEQCLDCSCCCREPRCSSRCSTDMLAAASKCGLVSQRCFPPRRTRCFLPVTRFRPTTMTVSISESSGRAWAGPQASQLPQPLARVRCDYDGPPRPFFCMPHPHLVRPDSPPHTHRLTVGAKPSSGDG
jgi:hypothetical protein